MQVFSLFGNSEIRPTLREHKLFIDYPLALKHVLSDFVDSGYWDSSGELIDGFFTSSGIEELRKAFPNINLSTIIDSNGLFFYANE